MNRRWKIVAALLGVFLAGVICGGAISDWSRGRNGTRLPFADKAIRRFEKQLELTPAQTERIRPVVLRTQTEWRQMRRDNTQKLTGVLDRMHDDIAAELLPEQRIQLEAIRDEFRTRAERLRSRTSDMGRD